MTKTFTEPIVPITWTGFAAQLLKLVVSPSIILCFPGLCIGQEWFRYTDLEERFTVNFPHEPEIQEISYLSEWGVEFPAQVYTAGAPPNRYSLTVVDYTETERLHRERSERTGIDVFYTEPIADVLGSVAYAAWNIRKRGGEVTYDAYHTVDFIEGHMLQVTNPDQSRTFVGIYLHASRLYILEATVPQSSPPPGHFQQSLGIFDEQGQRVRYHLDVDGNRARDYTETPYIDTLPTE